MFCAPKFRFGNPRRGNASSTGDVVVSVAPILTPPGKSPQVISQSVLKVRVQFGVPKLLAKVHPDAAAKIPAKNLCQVMLHKVAAACSQVAVLHLSTGVPPGEVLISPLLARLLSVEEEDVVEVAANGCNGHTPTHARQCLMQELPSDLGSQHCFMVQVDEALRKLLVQIHPYDAERLCIQNHEEVMLFNAASQCGHFAMAQTNHHIFEGELAMAPFMAGLLDVNGNDSVHVVPTARYMQDERAEAIKKSRARAAAVAITGALTNQRDRGEDGILEPVPPQRRRAHSRTTPGDVREKAEVIAQTADAVAKAPRPFRRWRSTAVLKSSGEPEDRLVLHRSASSWAGRVASHSRSGHQRALGSLQLAPLPPAGGTVKRGSLVPRSWKCPVQPSDCPARLTSDLGKDCREVSVEVSRWLAGETSGMRCAHVILDRVVTVLASSPIRESSNSVDILGGPLGAIVGGYNHPLWLLEEKFSTTPQDAVQAAFATLGLKSRRSGDWSNLTMHDVAVAFSRLNLQNQPSRGGDVKTYILILVSFEIVEAFCASCRADSDTPLDDQTTTSFTDEVLAELLRPGTEPAFCGTPKELEAMNRSLDEYLLRLMSFKSEIVSDVGRLHENCAYAVLGVTAEASDAEIKRAYKLSAMQCHPDKGGNKEQFQELASAYEKIMRQRFGASGDEPQDAMPAGYQAPKGAETAGSPGEPSKQPRPPRPSTTHSSGGPQKDGFPRSFTPPDPEVRGSNAKAESGKDSVPASESESGNLAERASRTLVEKAASAADQAEQLTSSAVDYAMKARNSAKAALAAHQNGATGDDVKPLAQSSIVLTLAAVKAVRVVAYCALEVASQCRHMSRHIPSATSCVEHSVTATGSGQEVLNVALASAILVEAIAKELRSAEAEAEQGVNVTLRFANAATNASLAAENAAKAARTAAASAVAGSKACKEAYKDKPTGEEEQGEKKPQPEASEACARLLAQRKTSMKLLRRLNGEILGYQHDVQRLQIVNEAIIPQISVEQKVQVFALLQAFLADVRTDLLQAKKDSTAGFLLHVILECLQKQQVFVGLVQDPPIAIPVSIQARTLRMAALHDIKLAIKLLEDDVFLIAQEAIRASSSQSMELVSKNLLEDFMAGVIGALKADVT
mmetsp:Transcript_29742/g.68474  ORF Transcript_29742/g.68474 Transcript_29742/m.68474 type:complete len:1135 (-) Transcript_29742:119-3523(-)